MLQLSDTKLHQIRQQISQQVAFPDELSEHFDEQQAHQLLADIADCRTPSDLKDLAAMMPRRRLNDIFGALLVMSAASGEQTALSLLSIVKQRITPSLAEMAWAFYQNHYPNDRMNRVMATIVSELSDREISLPHTLAISKVAALPIIDDSLPQRLAGDYLKSNIDEPLADYLVRMTLLPDSPFVVQFLASIFRAASDQLIQRDGELFIHALKLGDKQVKKDLLSHYLRQVRLGDDWEAINTALLEELGVPRPRRQQKIASLLGNSSDARIWDLLHIDVVDHFRQWEMSYRLTNHIGFSSRKKLFYQKVQPLLREISRWDEKTIVLHFDQFYLVDHSDENDKILYYDLHTYDIASESGKGRKALHKPEKSVTARDAVLSGNRHNIVVLQLDAVNLLYARDFISELLDPKKRLIE